MLDLIARSASFATLAVVFFLFAGCGEQPAPTSKVATPAPNPQSTLTSLVTLKPGDDICLMGNALAERMQHHGWLEARAQVTFQDVRPSFRNLGFSADEFTVHQRTSGFGSWDDYLNRCNADVVLAFFGFNESFAGSAGVEKFRNDVSQFIKHTKEQSYNGASAPRLVMVGSIPFENHNTPNLPDGVEHNRRIVEYNRAMAAVCQEMGTPFADVYPGMSAAFADAKSPLTINGIHLTEDGNSAFSKVLMATVFGVDSSGLDAGRVARVRDAVKAKNLLWFNRYRATDGYNVYGGRSALKYTDNVSNFTVLQHELTILDALCVKHTERIWGLARGVDNPVSTEGVPEPMVVVTNKPGKGPDGSHVFVDGEEAIKQMTLAPGMEVNLFADEKQFPELVNPVQMAWDTKGRLWVAVWPTYPHWEPGKPMNDKLLILEDTDGDGRANTCKVFVDDLHNPTGFEFWGGGVVVANAPDLLFLKDTDGDDVADERRRILHGLSSGDTHHAANSFVVGPGGALYFQEGTFHQSQIESIYGPVRNHNGCVWRFDPRTFLVERHMPYNFANPHGHVFDRWGQEFVTDGTGNQNYYVEPISGYIEHPAKHPGSFRYIQQRSRPCAATEILSSAHFPEANQGNLMAANVIGFQGLFQWEYHDEGSGFVGKEVDSVISSKDFRFRPADIEMGSDGAIYFLDWYNPIIGHMQHHLRDPSRDTSHGRVYRVTAKGRPLSIRVDMTALSIPDLIKQLKSREDRVRYRARLELSGRPSADVLAAGADFLAGLDPSDPDHTHHQLEILWLHQQHNVLNRSLLKTLLASEDYRARAAATRVVRGIRHLLDDGVALLTPMASDPHPRVRLETVVALSFFRQPRAVPLAFAIRDQPMDRFLTYAFKETMRALEPVWKKALRDGALDISDNPTAIAYVLKRVGPEELVLLPRTEDVLQQIVEMHGVRGGDRSRALDDLAKLKGTGRAQVLLSALNRLGGATTGESTHVLLELGGLLEASLRSGDTSVTPTEIAKLRRSGSNPTMRVVANALAMAGPGGVDAVWNASQGSRSDLKDVLDSIPLISDKAVRASVYGRVRPIMFSLPSAIDPAAAGAERAMTMEGLSMSYYLGTPKDAKLSTFRDLKPHRTTPVTSISLASDVITQRDRFGLLFEGGIQIPKDGRYQFFTYSDDGSRLYIDGKQVVNNDGPHGMVEKKGALQLTAGTHRIAITYFDQGGADGLRCSWAGPGFKKTVIPAAVLSTGTDHSVRASAIRAIASIDGHAVEKFGDASLLIGSGILVSEAVSMVEGLGKAGWVAGERNVDLISSIAGHVSGLTPENQTAASAVAALDLGKRLTEVLPGKKAEAARSMLSGLGGSNILIRTVPHRMLFDRTEFYVEAGKPVSIIFQNNDVMPHNLVITNSGAMQAVGEAAEAMAGTEGADAAGFIPDHEDVVWHTKLLLPGQTTRLTFVAPAAIGDMPYVCTYPGHWRVMNGVMHVVEKVDESVALAQVTCEETAPARKFVKNWITGDITPLLKEGWEKDCSIKRGKELFNDVGCIKCHQKDGVGEVTGVDLSEIGTTYTDAELLRHIVEPSASLVEGYENYLVILKSDRDVIGRIMKEDDASLHVCANLMDPTDIVTVKKTEVAERRRLKLSPMPAGLLVTLTGSEILDLLLHVKTSSKPKEKKVRATWIVHEGDVEKPGAGKHIVLISGDEEYRSEEALPMLARILSERHGFKCTVLFATDPKTGNIDPNNQTHITGLGALDDADMMVMFLRFRELPDADMKHIVDFVESGRPILGIRTSTHAFQYKRNPKSPYAHYHFRSPQWQGGFGRQVLGDTWINHHGHHGRESTRGIIESDNATHPILRGVKDVWGLTDVYGVRNLGPDSTILLRGQVLDAMKPDASPVEGKKNNPMIPLVWTRGYTGKSGRTSRIICSTIGASIDLLSHDLRRLMINACFWGLDMESRITPTTNATLTTPYTPTMYGFGSFQKGIHPSDLQ